MISSGSSAVVSAPTKKSAAVIVRDARRAGHGDLGIAGDGDARHFRRGIGMRDAAANRAAVADLVMRDVRDRRLQQRMRGREPRIVLDVAPAHHGAEPHAVGGNLDLVQLGQLAQVDEQRRRSDTERQHRHQALPAGDGTCLPIMGGKQRDGFGQRGGTGIFERRQFHGPTAFWLELRFQSGLLLTTWRRHSGQRRDPCVRLARHVTCDGAGARPSAPSLM